jgi:folate-binding protein YgfZ
MEKDQIILLENRGLVLISGEDAKNFLQNIITNDIEKVNSSASIFSALFTPQGKYLFEFFLIKSKNGYLLDCNNRFTKEIINYLLKYRLRSKVEIKDISSDYVIGLISSEKFADIQKIENKAGNTIEFRDSPLFLDPRNKKLGARILSSLEKLHLTIKKLGLKIIKPDAYFAKAHSLGVPIKGIENLKDQLFGLEANFEELNAIDFKKGCYIGQENTARMKLKEKLRRRLLPISSTEKLNLGEEIFYNKTKIGKILIEQPYPFGLVKVIDPNIEEFENKDLLVNNKKCKILKSV